MPSVRHSASADVIRPYPQYFHASSNFIERTYIIKGIINRSARKRIFLFSRYRYYRYIEAYLVYTQTNGIQLTHAICNQCRVRALLYERLCRIILEIIPLLSFVLPKIFLFDEMLATLYSVYLIRCYVEYCAWNESQAQGECHFMARIKVTLGFVKINEQKGHKVLLCNPVFYLKI